MEEFIKDCDQVEDEILTMMGNLENLQRLKFQTPRVSLNSDQCYQNPHNLIARRTSTVPMSFLRVTDSIRKPKHILWILQKNHSTFSNYHLCCTKDLEQRAP